MYKFTETTFEENSMMFDSYLRSLTGTNDDFWEGHILESKIYAIEVDGLIIGIFGIHNNENMTFFYVDDSALRHAQPVFYEVLELLKPKYAFVPTNDELFLSLSMDKHQSIEMQAYFFKKSDVAVRAPEFGRELMKLAKQEDIKDILDKDGVEENIRLGKYYVMRKDGVFLGQGFFNPQSIAPNSASIGMSVHPDHRQKGVGRSIIMHLSEMCCEQGIIPVCGCWYYNHNSKRTLESAGFVTQTRLLKVWFTEQK